MFKCRPVGASGVGLIGGDGAGSWARAQHLRGQLAADEFLGEVSGSDQCVEVDAGLVAEVIHHMHYVFCRNVAGRTRGVWASAKPSDGGIESPHAAL